MTTASPRRSGERGPTDGLVDPTDLVRLRGVLEANDPEGRLRPIGIKTIRMGLDALDELVQVVSSISTTRSIVVLTDSTPMLRETADLKALVVGRLRALADVRHVVIGRDGVELHADEAALAEADAAIAGAGCVVSVGSGTITDIAKDATHRAGDIPLVVVQTAVSVNAYSDDMAVLLRHGVKRTVPSRWPDALIVDLTTIAGAPAEMNRAGFGELASMFTAPADWYLAGALGMDDDWHPAPTELFRPESEQLLAAAAQVDRREPAALLLLARLMTLSGIALGVAGTSAPLSGTEHIISHLLDMAADRSGAPLNLHGAQVGVTAIVTAAAWQQTLDTFDPLAVDLEAAFPDADRVERRVRHAFSGLDPTGKVADECWRDVSRKLTRWSGARQRFEAFLGDWPRHRDALRALVVEPEVLAVALREAGAATTFAELAQAVSPTLAGWALRSSPLLRHRFVLADFRALTGAWRDTDINEILATTTAIAARA